jgi:hypothetical protein
LHSWLVSNIVLIFANQTRMRLQRLPALLIDMYVVFIKGGTDGTDSFFSFTQIGGIQQYVTICFAFLPFC